MQLTRFDRWLRERFVYETHIRTLRPAEIVPPSIRMEELPDVPGKRFRHLYIATTNHDADSFIASLRDANLMFSTTVVDRKAWYVKWIAPPEKSFTWRVIGLVMIVSSVSLGIAYLVDVFTRPEVQKLLSESLKTLMQ